MGTSANIERLKIDNYIRLAASTSNYWFDISYNKFINYKTNSDGNFNIVIYSELGSSDYYVIPYNSVKDLFQKKYLSVSNSGKKMRWIGRIKNHELKINNCPHPIKISKYFSVPF